MSFKGDKHDWSEAAKINMQFPIMPIEIEEDEELEHFYEVVDKTGEPLLDYHHSLKSDSVLADKVTLASHGKTKSTPIDKPLDLTFWINKENERH